ncbi:hypothetical protein BPTFM16_02123 [Altererythrobacter insulae]|nr:hypothetical protein BPTFM16_02123 [Altererythrobacter insulae]
MSVSNWPRLLTCLVVGLVLAAGLALHAVSAVSTRSAPELAVSVFPANGHARERLAFATFTGQVETPDQIEAAAQAASSMALDALRSDPLAPKAQAILAIAAEDRERRRAILDVAALLNRRDISLQGVLLEQHVSGNDYDSAIATLDQILRVHPEQSSQFFPLLSSTLSTDETIPLFAEMLDGSSPWHGRFLRFASRQRQTLPNFAKLRPLIETEEDLIDRRLIFGLVEIGDIAGAELLYRNATGQGVGIASEGFLDWRAKYAPIDWRLADEAGFRAQLAPDENSLEVSVRPGKGGMVAARLINAPAVPFTIRVEHRIALQNQLRDVRVQLLCPNSTTPFFDERLSRQGDGFEVAAVPEGCDYQILAINARAWSGRSALSGTIRSIEIS